MAVKTGSRDEILWGRKNPVTQAYLHYIMQMLKSYIMHNKNPGCCQSVLQLESLPDQPCKLQACHVQRFLGSVDIQPAAPAQHTLVHLAIKQWILDCASMLSRLDKT